MISARARKLRAELAVAARQSDPDKLADAQREYLVQRAEDFLSEVIDKVRPLTNAHINRLAAVLTNASRHG